MNPSILLVCCTTDGYGINNYKNTKNMIITNYGEGYGPNGTPINYVDKDGVFWIYQGKGKDGSDNWRRGY